VIQAVVFDLDGVLLDSEQLWDEVRREVVGAQGGYWTEGATTAMQGMSAPEWSRYMREELGLQLAVERIDELVVAGLRRRYQRELPLLTGAVEAVARLAERWPLGLASSSNRVVIDEVLAGSGLTEHFTITVSSEEVPRGKPAPDVYLEATRRLGRAPEECAAVEDATNGIRSALAAGLRVIAIPNRTYPPPAGVLTKAHAVLRSITELDPKVVEEVAGDGLDSADRRLDEQERESFPASDAHSDWAGPAS
jgi:HAD superfamily hydrolase (TIGR01509 family)